MKVFKVWRKNRRTNHTKNFLAKEIVRARALPLTKTMRSTRQNNTNERKKMVLPTKPFVLFVFKEMVHTIFVEAFISTISSVVLLQPSFFLLGVLPLIKWWRIASKNSNANAIAQHYNNIQHESIFSITKCTHRRKMTTTKKNRRWNYSSLSLISVVEVLFVDNAGEHSYQTYRKKTQTENLKTGRA